MAIATLSLSKAALVMIGDLATGMYKSFHPHPYYHIFCKHSDTSFRSILSQLEKTGQITVRIVENKRIFSLTKKGEQKRNEAMRDISLARKREELWDKKWRIIIFDIPEQRRKHRSILRYQLYNFGFVQLQKSVWITPFAVEDELREVINRMNLAECIKFAVVEAWNDDGDIKKLFGIS